MTMTWYLTQAHYPDAKLTSSFPILLMASGRLGSDKYKFKSHWFDWTGNRIPDTPHTRWSRSTDPTTAPSEPYHNGTMNGYRRCCEDRKLQQTNKQASFCNEYNTCKWGRWGMPIKLAKCRYYKDCWIWVLPSVVDTVLIIAVLCVFSLVAGRVSRRPAFFLL